VYEQPPGSGKAIIFQANAKFLGQKPAAINEKMYLLKGKNQNSFHQAR